MNKNWKRKGDTDMSTLTEIIQGRRSIRKYEQTPVADEHLQAILEAVQWAPSWANTQIWEVVVIKDAGTKEKLQLAMAPKNPATKAIVDAPIVLALCAKLGSSGYYSGVVTTKHQDWYMFDLGLAAQNICLTAHDLGLATVIVGLYDHNKVNEILKVPAGYDNVALIPLGYAAKSGLAPKRRELSEIVHYDVF